MGALREMKLEEERTDEALFLECGVFGATPD